MSPKKYVLTGGPSAGKSSIILGLEFLGEYVIGEVATDYIRYKKAQGVKEPWFEPDFQDRILSLQMLRESKIPNSVDRIFLDRGLPDGLAYARQGTKVYDKIMNASKKVMYNKIFIVEPLDFTETTELRRENREEALRLCQQMEQIYKNLGYQPVTIPAASLEERIKTLFNNLE